MQKQQVAFQTSRGERVAYPLFAFGQNLVYGLVSGYLSLFYTDHLFIPAIAVSAIFLVAKVWDAVNDPLFGIIVDRVTFKTGKFRPWLKVSTVAIPIATVLIFCVPSGLPMGWRVGLSVAAYLLWDIAYTLSDVPVFSLLTAMTGSVQERSTLISRGSVAGIVCGILLIIVLAPQLDTIGFLPVALIVGAVAFGGMLPLTLTAKERGRPPAATDGENPALRDIWHYLKGNRYLGVFMAASLIMGTLNISLALNNYIMIYFFGGLKFMALLTAIGVAPLLLVYLAMPKITAKIDRMVLYRASVLITLGMNIVLLLVGPGNIVLYAVLAITKTVIATPQGMLAFTFTMDCVEYGHYKTGQRREGITLSVQAFVNKFTSAVSNSLMLLVLGLVGYVGELEAQSPGTLSAMWTANYLVPIAGILLCLPLLFAYKLRVRDVQLMADINMGKISRGEGEAQMSRRY